MRGLRSRERLVCQRRRRPMGTRARAMFHPVQGWMRAGSPRAPGVVLTTAAVLIATLTPSAHASPRGATLWVVRFGGDGFAPDTPEGVAASPDGSRVFVTGR